MAGLGSQVRAEPWPRRGRPVLEGGVSASWTPGQQGPRGLFQNPQSWVESGHGAPASASLQQRCRVDHVGWSPASGHAEWSRAGLETVSRACAWPRLPRAPPAPASSQPRRSPGPRPQTNPAQGSLRQAHRRGAILALSTWTWWSRGRPRCVDMTPPARQLSRDRRVSDGRGEKAQPFRSDQSSQGAGLLRGQ